MFFFLANFCCCCFSKTTLKLKMSTIVTQIPKNEVWRQILVFHQQVPSFNAFLLRLHDTIDYIQLRKSFKQVVLVSQKCVKLLRVWVVMAILGMEKEAEFVFLPHDARVMIANIITNKRSPAHYCQQSNVEMTSIEFIGKVYAVRTSGREVLVCGNRGRKRPRLEGNC